MIYSKKYGRNFKNRSELQRYAFWDYRTKPIFSWFGLRDCMYSEQYKKEHGLIKDPTQPSLGVIFGIACVIVFFILIALSK